MLCKRLDVAAEAHFDQKRLLITVPQSCKWFRGT